MKQKKLTGDLSLTARGFGFVQPKSGHSILVPYDHLLTATSGDTVEVELFENSRPDKPAGRITSVLKRTATPVVGRARWHGKELRVHPQGNRVPRPVKVRGATKSVRDGDVLRVRILTWEDPEALPEGELLDILARKGDADLEVKLIAGSRGFALEFPEPVIRAAETCRLPNLQKLPRDRNDLRGTVCFTIDPDQARDFDDAMSVSQREDGLFELGIHIADVTAFVDENGPLDREAWERATSVYLVDHVLPMLPERLSNELCSLVPGEDRLAMSVMVTLDSRGTVHRAEIQQSVIRSRRRFTYREAEAIIDGAEDPLARQVHLLHLLSQTLRLRREEAGSVDFDFSTPQIRVDDEGVPISVRPAERLAANRMVEECMLLANRIVAQRLAGAKQVPGVYRVHDLPRESDVQELVETLESLGVKYRSGTGAGDFRAILAIVQNFEFRDLAESLASRALAKAVYSTENTGHFGLAMDAYTHFTSPIRRYPDILVHRLLKRTLAGGRKDGGRSKRGGDGLLGFLKKSCAHANERERAATDAEREYTRMKALEFLQRRIGRTYSGVISGVATIGLFVEIERYLIEGLVHISTLGKERFELDKPNYRLVGQKSGTTYRLGDAVTVTVTAVDVESRTASFVLASQDNGGK